ncbi:MAG: 23S rRNA (adenine(2503)-C(2))-methyltransferase RlmN [Ruminococcaceae bacterium]|nr:23S rRNA (adenine(2503)-C(2))-methyltransferase RlmN [Oscillospiraceae bacterium]
MTEEKTNTANALPDIMSMTREELKEFVVSIGEKGFRAEQLFRWMHKGAPYEEMTNLSAAFIQKLKECAQYRLPIIEQKLVSREDGTIKYLMSLVDGECVESVFMRYEHGNTLCISSQAGCRMGCKFCASTLNGRVRNLTPSEILGQVSAATHDTGERVDGIVMMGIGEPLDNYDNVIRFLHLVSDEKGLGIGLRHISLSTCGVVPGIYALAKEGLPVTLSVSLHASRDDVRSELMPINRKYPIAELLAACRHYFNETGRRVSFEYTLIEGKNDGEADAVSLAKVMKNGMRCPCHVNLIMLNEVKETGLRSAGRRNAMRFAEVLKKNGVNATIRRKLGGDIEASCGQLRLRAKGGPQKGETEDC